MRSLRLTFAALLAASSFGLLASCQPKTTDTTPVMSHADSLKASEDSLRLSAAAERGGRAFLAHCAMCHGNGGTGDGEAAAQIKDRGASVARLNDPEMMDKLSRPQLIEVIQKGGAHTGRSNFMPAWGEKLDPAMVGDIADFVITLRTVNPAIPRQTLASYLMAPTGVPADGRELFVHHCVACHGDEGKGDGPYGKRLLQDHKVTVRNLTDSTYFANKMDKELYAVVALGGGHFRKAVFMPAWTVTLSPAQIKSLVAYVHAISHTAPKP
jgi:cbb3-type cytochrome c oxidase subunit III